MLKTYYCRKSVPVTLDDGESVLIQSGEYVEIKGATAQVNRLLKNGSLILRNAPDGATVVRPKKKE
jgi:hypothetical protein